MKNKEVRILILPGAHFSPSARFRLHQFVPLLRNHYDITVRVPIPDRELKTKTKGLLNWDKVHSRISQMTRLITTFWIFRDIKSFDLVITNRDVVPDIKVFYFERRINRRKIPLIVDIDDAVFLGNRKEKMDYVFSCASQIIVGNEYLKSYTDKFTNSLIIPTVVDTDKFVPKALIDTDGLVRIGWSGSDQTARRYLPLMFNVFSNLVGKYKAKVRFLIVSNTMPEVPETLLEFIDFEPWSEVNEPFLIKKMDIGIMPLFDNEFERGKCGLKLLEYMSVSIPVLASPVGVNSKIVEHGASGYLCENEEDWIKYLSLLIENPDLRLKLGRHGRARVESEYSLVKAADQWVHVIDSILNK